MTESEERVVRRGLTLFRDRRAGPRHYRDFGVVLRNEHGKALGGISGYTMWDWLRTDVIWLPEELRGKHYGRALLERAEGIARGRGCTSAMLYSFEFEARDFFEANGYMAQSKVENLPFGHTRYHFVKAL